MAAPPFSLVLGLSIQADLCRSADDGRSFPLDPGLAFQCFGNHNLLKGCCSLSFSASFKNVPLIPLGRLDGTIFILLYGVTLLFKTGGDWSDEILLISLLVDRLWRFTPRP